MKAVMFVPDDPNAALQLNLEKQQQVRERLRQAVDWSEIHRQPLSEHQALLTELYREMEQLAGEYQHLKQQLAKSKSTK